MHVILAAYIGDLPKSKNDFVHKEIEITANALYDVTSLAYSKYKPL